MHPIRSLSVAHLSLEHIFLWTFLSSKQGLLDVRHHMTSTPRAFVEEVARRAWSDVQRGRSTAGGNLQELRQSESGGKGWGRARARLHTTFISRATASANISKLSPRDAEPPGRVRCSLRARGGRGRLARATAPYPRRGSSGAATPYDRARHGPSRCSTVPPPPPPLLPLFTLPSSSMPPFLCIPPFH